MCNYFEFLPTILDRLFKEFSVFRSAAILFSGAETFDDFVQGLMRNLYIRLY